MSASQTQGLYTGLLLGLMAAAVWGAFPVITRLGIEQTLTPYDITALRYAIAGALLFPVFWRHGLAGLGLGKALLLMCGAGAPYLGIAIGGLTFAPVGHFAIIAPSAMLLFSTLGAGLWLNERLTGTRLLGVSIIITGILIVGWEGLSAQQADTWIGDVMFVLAGCFWGSYTLACRYWSIKPLHAISIVSVLSMIAYVPAYLALNAEHLLHAPATELIVQGVFQGVFSAVLALLFYTRAVAILGAARGAVFGALVPAFALLLAIPVLGETPTHSQLLGVVIVSTGMLFSLGLVHRAKPQTQSR